MPPTGGGGEGGERPTAPRGPKVREVEGERDAANDVTGGHRVAFPGQPSSTTWWAAAASGGGEGDAIHLMEIEGGGDEEAKFAVGTVVCEMRMKIDEHDPSHHHSQAT